MTTELTQASFDAVTQLFHDVSGIRLTEAKRALVVGRLHKLAIDARIADINTYIQQAVLGHNPQARSNLVDRLTTNETYFFREPQHFTLLADLAAMSTGPGPFRVWSAASSTGEEAYSIAMILADHFGPRGWEVFGSDLSSTVVANARRGLYSLDRIRDTPPRLIHQYGLRGQGPYEGQWLIARELRQRVQFRCINLTEPPPDIGDFDVIFLRNVLIYFDAESKQRIVRNVLERLKPSGLLFTGHAEPLGQRHPGLRLVRSAVYERA